ncbi:MAG: ATP-dependent Clp protease proteolytic subunit, partial [Candidatus Paceibacterota bacterium]
MNNQFPPINENQLIKLETFKERLKKREIWLNGLIDDSLVEKLYANLIDLESQNNSLPITVVINSDGGNLWESAVATDIMGTLNCPIKTIALAKANSGGFMIFMGGEERICHD